MTDDFVNKLISFRQSKVDGIQVVTGDGESADPRVNGNPNLIWVRFEERDPETGTEVFSRAAFTAHQPGAVRTDQANIYVIIKQNGAGEWYVDRIDELRAPYAQGAEAQNSSVPTIVPEAKYDMVTSRRLAPLRVRLKQANTLIVVIDPGWYRDTSGDLKYWAGGRVAELDLSGDVPAAVSGVNQQRWVVITLNPDATTPAIVRFTGTPTASTLPLPPDALASIAVTAGYYRLAAIRLVTGDTTVDELRFFDMREWLNTDPIDTGGGGSGGGVASDPQAYIAGYEVNVSSAGDVASIAAGTCRNDDDTYTLTKTTSTSVDLAVSGAGGLDTGSPANDTWYYLWIIAKSSDGTTDGLASLSSTTPTLPSGYDKQRRVGAVRRNGSGVLWRQLTRRGAGNQRHVIYQEDTTPVSANFRILNAANISTGGTWDDVDCSACVPATSRMVDGRFHLELPSVAVSIFWREKGVTSQAQWLTLAGTAERNGSAELLDLDASQVGQVTALVAATDNFYFLVQGYVDNLTPAIAGSSGADQVKPTLSAANVSNPPTESELDSIFGTAASLGSFMGFINDNNADTDGWLCVSDGTNWWYQAMTKAV